MAENTRKVLEWVILFGSLAGAIAASKWLSLSPKWEHSLVYTAIVFVVLTMSLRPIWGMFVF